MARSPKAKRRARERRQASFVLTLLGVALIASIGAWAVFFRAWMPGSDTRAPRFALPASTGQTVKLDDFLGNQDVVLVFYMVAT